MIFASTKMRNITFLLFMCALLTACSSQGSPFNEPSFWSAPHSSKVSSSSSNEYEIRVGIVHHTDGISHESPLQQLWQSNLVNLDVRTISFQDWTMLDLAKTSFDLLLIDDSLSRLVEREMKLLIKSSRQFVEQGGTLLLPHGFAKVFPQDLIGIEATKEISSTSIAFDYPEVSLNLQSLQDVWYEFADTYERYDGLHPDLHISHEFGVIPNTAEAVVSLDGAALLTANKVGKGTLIWANQFLPNQQFITRLDFTAEEEQPYFHFGYTTANYLFHTEIAAFAAKEKYGFALSKAYGPYGRPGLAWQNHYEETNSFLYDDMIKWSNLLYENKQIPTFSLVRSSYNGGSWHTAISWNENVGTASAPAFTGETYDSLFTTGIRLETEKDYLTFDHYKGYNSLRSKNITGSHRAYITAVDWDNNGKWDLIVGDATGSVWLLKQKDHSPGNLFDSPVKIPNVKTGSFAAPIVGDINRDGKWDLVAGDGEGRLFSFLNIGKTGNPKFAKGKLIPKINVSGPSAPYLADWNGDGTLDLIIGDGEGFVHLYIGTLQKGQMNWKYTGKLTTNGKALQAPKHAAPHVVDWNGDGRTDLLVGSFEGTIHLYLRAENGELIDSGLLESQNYNFFGDKQLIPGKNSVPLVVDWNDDGKPDLLTGHLEYGIPRPVDSAFFPHSEQVSKNIKYVLDHHIPLIPHMFLGHNSSVEQEQREMALHKESFHNLGIPWDNDMGVNHHTWRINNDALQTFRNQAAVGIWWNFGFNPPHVGSAPRDGKEFLMGIPFDLSKQIAQSGVDGENVPFLLHVPAPNIMSFPRGWDALARFNVPLTNFEHIEYGQREGSDINNKLIEKIHAINDFRYKNGYTFMSEQQMARSLLNTFHGNVKVEWKDQELKLTPDMDNVPWQVKEYANTLGVRVELGEKYAHLELDTDSMFYYKDRHAYYIGLDSEINIQFTEKSTMDHRIYVVKTNAPTSIEHKDGRIKVTLDTAGMQEITFHSPVPLDIIGENLDYVTQDGNEYTIVHYGLPVTFEIIQLKEQQPTTRKP